ncbi:MAG: N-acyl homoserine lactonase family protein [Nevskia sp.]|nr:N-acyl homoserine lactonase family protein [Nevskia sp.]
MKNTQVALLDGGEMSAKEYQVYWNYPSEKLISMPTYGVLIDHADGRFMFDTGFDLAHFNKAIAPKGALQSQRQTIPGQLDLLGLRGSDINYVINSHYHFDHCGGNKHCTHATTICHKCELEAAANPEPFEKFVYSDRSFEGGQATAPDLEIYTPRFETLSGDQEIAKGVHLFETPGHTLGHYSLMLELSNRRPMLFTADACYTQKGLDTMMLASAHVDPVRGYKSMLRLKEIAEKYDAEIFFAHDAENYGRYLKAPYWYS